MQEPVDYVTDQNTKPVDLTDDARVERIDAWIRELWSAHSLDLHMCDGSTRLGQSGLLRNIRDDVRFLRDRVVRTAD